MKENTPSARAGGCPVSAQETPGGPGVLLAAGVMVLSSGGCNLGDCAPGQVKVTDENGNWPRCMEVASASEGDSENGTGSTGGSGTDAVTEGAGGMCGNGVVEAGEVCDDGTQNGMAGKCDADCSGSCGDMVVSGTEVCDDGPQNGMAGACYADCSGSCGDMTVSGTEACDDGNAIDTDDCVACAAAKCGDGFVWSGKEACDDGNAVDTDDCVVCAAAKCGDGAVWAGMEACDDGNAVDTDDCVGCAAAKCGDGFVWSGKETCDDGMMNGMPGMCHTDCSGKCGDGVVNGMEEECDDANAVDDDGCSNTCEAPRRVFATSGKFDGNLGGLEGAKAKCEAAAMGAGLGGSWEVWLSDDTGSPSTRFETSFGGYYALVDMNKTPVAKGWAGLTSGSLLAAIDTDEKGEALVDPKNVWSNTTEGGVKAGVSCKNWTSAAFTEKGRLGATDKLTGEWTDLMADNPINCGTSLHLYCFEDP